jgi:hypothetical protein
MRLFLILFYNFRSFAALTSKVFGVSNEPELFNMDKSKDCCGYFQKYEYFLDNKETLFKELANSLKKIELPIMFTDWQNKQAYQCLHIRRGDFLLPENSGYGLLSLEWYRNYREPNLRTVIVTDDKLGAEMLLATFEDCLVLGPEEANVFQTLSIMGNSAHLVAANSTLSWWGGFLVAMRGQSVVYPISEIEEHRDINFPFFKLKKAIFE